MSKAKRLGNLQNKTQQWITDAEPCRKLQFIEPKDLIVEVLGDIGSKGVTLYGSLTDTGDMAKLVHVKSAPWVGTLPPVSFLKPETDAHGVTITVRGVHDA